MVIVMVFLSAKTFKHRMWPHQAITAAAGVTAGKPRDVDVKLLEQLIQQGKLSDHEAQFYRKLEENDDFKR